MGTYIDGLTAEHIWLDNRPIGLITPSGLYYVHTDQLGTPRDITNASKAVVWQWNSDPFGNGTPTGSITYNLRFPGQYYDAETGRNYNYFRDYDPTIGRYIEPDPLGTLGLKTRTGQLAKFYSLATWNDMSEKSPPFLLPDLNLYSYTNQNPINRFDVNGKISMGELLIAVPIIVGGAVFLDLYAQRKCEQHCAAPGICPIKGDTGNPTQDQEQSYA
ncbi:MAG: RHS repeat domain-containing protein [Gammaproteobacteria bacterium]